MNFLQTFSNSVSLYMLYNANKNLAAQSRAQISARAILPGRRKIVFFHFSTPLCAAKSTRR